MTTIKIITVLKGANFTEKAVNSKEKSVKFTEKV